MQPGRESQHGPLTGTTMLELYVAGDNLNARKAIANLEEIIKRLGTSATFVVVDVTKDPKTAFARRIFATPSLVSFLDGKQNLIVGDLSNIEVVVQRLGG